MVIASIAPRAEPLPTIPGDCHAKPPCALARALAVLDPARRGTRTSTPPTVDVLLGGERVRLPLQALVDRAPLAADQDFRVVEIGRDASTSHHVVAIRTAEAPHRHDRHDLLVLIVRG